MNRSVFASALTLLFCTAVASSAWAQAKPAVAPAAAAPAPAAKAGFVTPLKGEGTVQVLPGVSKFDPKLKEVVTTYKIKNTSSAPIALLKLDEYWYDKNTKIVTSAQYAHKKAPIQPGEIVEITLRSPIPPGVALSQDQIMFRHANGDVKANKVKDFK